MNTFFRRLAIGCGGLAVGFLPVAAMAQSAQDCARATLSIDAAGAKDGRLEKFLYPDDALEIDAAVRLRTDLDPSLSGAGGWSISVVHDPMILSLIEVTIRGTDAFNRSGFQKTEPVSNETGSGFISATVLADLGPQCCYLPPVGEFSLVRAVYRFRPPPAASSPSGVETRIEFRDGLRGSGQPVSNQITYQGSSLAHCREPLDLRIEIVDTRPFSRGDANYDLTLDISDAVTVLRSLFFGDAEIHCDDAADANDDGEIDISDAIAIFGHLFLGDPPPPAPFPEQGEDPTGDPLRCRP